MIIKTISLQHFRNFARKKFEFDERATVIIGPNASGKTNMLEAVNLLATGKSFHASLEQEMVKNRDPWARVQGEISTDGEKVKLEAVLTRGELNGTRVSRKKLSVNGVNRRLYNFTGTLKTVLFGPWDLSLVTESPSTRRGFLDDVLSQVDREYRRAILSYEKGIRQRNKLLERIREGEAVRSQLLFWNQLLVKNGDYITQKRGELIDFINQTEALEEKINLKYDNSTISEGRLEQYKAEEIAAAKTLVGPHRDDFSFQTDKGRDLAIYGSRGEQRMAVLWLKLAELSFIESNSGERPVLLLDDIFSELDQKHRETVVSIVDKQQTIITTVDPHTVEDWRKSATLIELR